MAEDLSVVEAMLAKLPEDAPEIHAAFAAGAAGVPVSSMAADPEKNITSRSIERAAAEMNNDVVSRARVREAASRMARTIRANQSTEPTRHDELYEVLETSALYCFDTRRCTTLRQMLQQATHVAESQASRLLVSPSELREALDKVAPASSIRFASAAAYETAPVNPFQVALESLFGM